MDAISSERAGDVAGAVRAVQQPGAVFIGGGTNLLDLMKGGVARPMRLIDITHISGLDRSPRCRMAASASAPWCATAMRPITHWCANSIRC